VSDYMAARAAARSEPLSYLSFRLQR
jgi:hypothetical protein